MRKHNKKWFFDRGSLIDKFGFADQGKISNGLGFYLVLKRDNVDYVNFTDNRVAASKDLIYYNSWLIEKFTPNLDSQQLVADQMISEFQAELNHEERTVFSRKYLIKALWRLIFPKKTEKLFHLLFS